MGTIVLLMLIWIAVGVLVCTQRLRRVVSLRVALACLAISLTLTLALLLLVERRQQATIVRQMEQRGETIATHLAAVSTKSLLTYNFVTLEQDAAQTAQARDVLYTIIHDREGRVAAYSGHSEKQGLVLSDAVSWQATQASTMLIQHVPHTQGTAEHYDIAVPVFVPGSRDKWGMVRVGLSLHEMHRDIAQTGRQVLLWSVLGVASSVVVAAFLISQAHRAENVR
jgi:sensor histidine kinase regulating citrate/malate metabolism